MKAKNLSLLTVLLLLSFLLLEVGLRLFTVFPIHGRMTNRIRDEKLLYGIDPALESIDENGFRNPKVLKHSYIATIGDSHTYGNNVESEDSWPYQLGRMLNKSIYNFGVGGYGLIQYYYLMDEALKLRPKHIIIGLYIANDLHDIKPFMNDRLPPELIPFLDNCGLGSEDNDRVKSQDYKVKMKCLIKRTALGSLLKYLADKFLPSDNRYVVQIKENNNKTIISHSRITRHELFMNLDSEQISTFFGISKRMIRKLLVIHLR